MRSLLGRRDVRLLLAGQTLSMFGDWAMIIVLGIWAKVLTGSNAQAGLVFFVFALASLAAPVGGLLVDRVHKRPLMIATHVAMAGVVCLLFFVHDASQMWLLYLVTALYGLGGDVFGAARSAMLKAMLPDELLADANGALQSIREGLRLVAPLAGAGIYAAFGGGVVALVDAASFLASAATLDRAAVRRAGTRNEAAPLPPRDLDGRHAHRTHARVARADDRRRRGAARRRLQRDADLRARRTRCTARLRSSASWTRSRESERSLAA